MKKLVSVLLAVVMMASVISISFIGANAQESDPFLSTAIRAKFVEEYGVPQGYEEIYYHYSNEDETVVDWVLLHCITEIMVEPIENPTPRHYIVGDIVYSTIYYLFPFSVPYCVYDCIEDKFVPVSDTALEQYDGLREVFCTGKYGIFIGDVDIDGAITIMDVTEIQCVIAKLSELSNFYVADFNRDKSFDILDATAVQLKLAGLDKPVVNEEMIMAVINSSALRQPRPDDAVSVPFVTEFSAQQFLSPIFDESSMPYDDVIFVIKSKEQYYSIFNSRAPEFTDEFFESKWLVAVFERTGCYEAVASLDGISKHGDTLYVTNHVFVPDNDGFVQPLDPFWLTIASVDREYLEDVYSVVKTK